MTVAGLTPLYIAKHAKPTKRTWEQDQRILDVNVIPLIGTTKITALTRRDIRDVIDKLADDGKLRMSSRVLAVVRKMLGWAVEQDYLPDNPANGIKKRVPDTKRDRVLTDAEAITFFTKINQPTVMMTPAMRDVFHLLVLTGQRVGEVTGMHISEIDLEKAQWTIPGSRTKNGLTHVVPLSRQVKRIITRAIEKAGTGGFLFYRVQTKPFASNAVSHALRRVHGKNPVDWTPHDLRRTAVTGMAKIKIPPHVVEAVVNHVSGAKAGVAGLYNRHSYIDERTAALQEWADHFDMIMGKPVLKAVSNG
jgi:integrase